MKSLWQDVKSEAHMSPPLDSVRIPTIVITPTITISGTIITITISSITIPQATSERYRSTSANPLDVLAPMGIRLFGLSCHTRHL